MPSLAVRNLSKSYGGPPVLDDVTFEIAEGELFTLLGPSGCGKTTTLMAIAGFVKPDGGVITRGSTTFFEDERRINLAPERRDLGMVFQSYAVWPHMTVAGNVAFALKLRRLDRETVAEKVTQALDLVELADLGNRYPHELSGGQRQRVALARALAYQPSVLLLDEPFSNLDAQLRARTRSWLRGLQRRLGLTTVFVTHDQDEAMEMSDRILVLDGGRVQQIGAPEAVYQGPANRFVAGFVGSSNVLNGVVSRTRQPSEIEVSIGAHCPPLLVSGANGWSPDAMVSVAIRPEAVRVLGPDHATPPVSGTANVFEAQVTSCAFMGDHYRYEVAIGDVRLVATGAYRVGEGARRVAIDPKDCLVMSAEINDNHRNEEREEAHV